MSVFSYLLLFLVLVKMNNSTSYQKANKYIETNKWTNEEHALISRALKHNNNRGNIQIIAKHFNRSVEDIKEQLKELAYLLYVKMISENIAISTGFTVEQTFDIINDKNPLKNEITEMKNEIKELKTMINYLIAKKM